MPKILYRLTDDNGYLKAADIVHILRDDQVPGRRETVARGFQVLSGLPGQVSDYDYLLEHQLEPRTKQVPAGLIRFSPKLFSSLIGKVEDKIKSHRKYKIDFATNSIRSKDL